MPSSKSISSSACSPDHHELFGSVCASAQLLPACKMLPTHTVFYQIKKWSRIYFLSPPSPLQDGYWEGGHYYRCPDMTDSFKADMQLVDSSVEQTWQSCSQQNLSTRQLMCNMIIVPLTPQSRSYRGKLRSPWTWYAWSLLWCLNSTPMQKQCKQSWKPGHVAHRILIACDISLSQYLHRWTPCLHNIYQKCVYGEEIGNWFNRQEIDISSTAYHLVLLLPEHGSAEVWILRRLAALLLAPPGPGMQICRDIAIRMCSHNSATEVASALFRMPHDLAKFVNSILSSSWIIKPIDFS